MKHYFTIFLLFLGLFIHAQKVDFAATQANFSIKQGGYFTEEIGGYGALPLLTLGYEYVKPLNENMFLSTRAGINVAVGFFGYHIGIPHGASLNFGKKHFYFETGLNGWYGFTQDSDAMLDGKENYNGYSYLVGVNLGLNTVFAMKKRNVMYRIYVNPWYNTTNNNGLIRKTFIWGGMACSIQLGHY